MMRKDCDRSAGFTLTELLAAMAVVGVVMSLALPAFARTLELTRVSSVTSELYQAIILARAEALKRHSRVVMCPSNNGVTCSAGERWGSGWIVFHDADDDGVPAAGEPILLRNTHGAEIDVDGSGVFASYISYVESGRTRQLNGALLMGVLRVCGAYVGREIVINHVGRPRIREVECTNG